MNFEETLRVSCFAFNESEREKFLTKKLVELTKFHEENCPKYRSILKSINFSVASVSSYKEIPFIPVRLFKELELKSVPSKNIVKILNSSGTTKETKSRIYLDRKTSLNQQKVMVKIVSEFIGVHRMPMFIVDCPTCLKDKPVLSARDAGILGFSIFGTEKFYALDSDMKLNTGLLKKFLEKHRDRKILIFGFTYILWQYFYKELLRLREEGVSFDLSNGVLIHGGGWKNLALEALDRDEFRQKFQDICNLRYIYNYYGMTEQMGCVYMECEYGYFHTPVFADVVIRREIDFSEAEMGEPGIIQVISTIPRAYPGHSLLTEDEGVILGIDNCPCGRKGKCFKVIGRLQHAEIRGCSDTYKAE